MLYVLNNSKIKSGNERNLPIEFQNVLKNWSLENNRIMFIRNNTKGRSKAESDTLYSSPSLSSSANQLSKVKDLFFRFSIELIKTCSG